MLAGGVAPRCADFNVSQPQAPSTMSLGLQAIG
nr:MAG TPA: hypothetical protein [Caudoviricetes sp.]